MYKNTTKIIDLSVRLQEQKAELEYRKNTDTILDNLTLEKINDVLHLPSYLDEETVASFADDVLRYEINELDLCYDVLTMDVLEFDDKYEPLIWVEMCEYVFHYLKDYKENDEYDEYPGFFERVKGRGEARKLQSITDLRQKKKWDHIRACLKQGKEGVEQLIDERINKGFTETDLSSFDNFIDMLERGNKNPYTVFTHAVTLSAYDFYKEHEWNWYICLSETIYFIASLKYRESEHYEESLDIITQYMNKDEK